MKLKYPVVLISGLTCCGKSDFLRKFLSLKDVKLNVVSGDLMHTFSEFPVLTNNMVGTSTSPLPNMSDFVRQGTKFNMYGIQKSTNVTTGSSFEYATQVIKLLEPERLNIIEGGNAYYQMILQRELPPEVPRKTIILYYDYQRNLKLLLERSKRMLLSGAFREVWEFEQELIKSGQKPPPILPIGYDEILQFMKLVRSEPTQQKQTKNTNFIVSSFENLLQKFTENQRGYSSRQLKYMKKFAIGPGFFWYNVVDESIQIQNLTANEVLAFEGQKDPNFKNFQRGCSRAYVLNLAKRSKSEVNYYEIGAAINEIRSFPSLETSKNQVHSFFRS